MEVKLVKIDDVKPYESNPRINDAAVEAVAASLREFGFRQPVVVDEVEDWAAVGRIGPADEKVCGLEVAVSEVLLCELLEELCGAGGEDLYRESALVRM